MKYVVEVKYTNPSHEHVSLRRKVHSVNRIIEASNPEEAIFRVTRQQRALGFMVSEAKIVEEQKPEVAAEVLVEGRFRRSMSGYAVLGGYGADSKRLRYKSSADRAREINVGLDDKQEKENALRATKADKAKMNKEEVEQVDEGAATHHGVVVDSSSLQKPKNISGLARKHGGQHAYRDPYGSVYVFDNKDGAKSFQNAVGSAASHIKATQTRQIMKSKGLGEEVEQLDEIGNTPGGKKTLAQYTKAAATDLHSLGYEKGYADGDRHYHQAGTSLNAAKQTANRKTGIKRAVDRLAREEVEQVDEGSKRMSAAVKLQRAFKDAQQQSTASRERGKEILDQARAEYAKKQVTKTNEDPSSWKYTNEEAEQIDELKKSTTIGSERAKNFRLHGVFPRRLAEESPPARVIAAQKRFDLEATANARNTEQAGSAAADRRAEIIRKAKEELAKRKSLAEAKKPNDSENKPAKALLGQKKQKITMTPGLTETTLDNKRG